MPAIARYKKIVKGLADARIEHHKNDLILFWRMLIFADQQGKTGMKSYLYIVLFTACFSIILAGCYSYFSNTIFIDSIIESIHDLPKGMLLKDDQGYTWAIYPSTAYGFGEFWIAFSQDGRFWQEPIYTGFPVAGVTQYEWNVKSDTLHMRMKNRPPEFLRTKYMRQTAVGMDDSCALSLRDLFADTDMDGLTDFGENVLRTNPHDADTDHDGKADGFDQNPLAAPAKSYLVHERLHKFVIEQELKLVEGSGLVIVEQINHKPMEYERTKGLILSLSPDSADAFVNLFGYGVPILTTTIHDTLKKYKVSFQYFIAPEDAWGYDALYDWDRKQQKWQRKRLYSSWIAE